MVAPMEEVGHHPSDHQEVIHLEVLTDRAAQIIGRNLPRDRQLLSLSLQDSHLKISLGQAQGHYHSEVVEASALQSLLVWPLELDLQLLIKLLEVYLVIGTEHLWEVEKGATDNNLILRIFLRVRHPQAQET